MAATVVRPGGTIDNNPVIYRWGRGTEFVVFIHVVSLGHRPPPAMVSSCLLKIDRLHTATLATSNSAVEPHDLPAQARERLVLRYGLAFRCSSTFSDDLERPVMTMTSVIATTGTPIISSKITAIISNSLAPGMPIRIVPSENGGACDSLHYRVFRETSG